MTESKYKVGDKVIFSYNGYENEQGVITRIIETIHYGKESN